MSEIATIAAAVISGGGITFVGQTIAKYFEAKSAHHATDHAAALSVEQHRDNLTFELLQAARDEVAAARLETVELRGLQLRLVHFDEALDHIEAILKAEGEDERHAAERRAHQFLVRMKRFTEATGTMRNEVQVIVSKEALGHDPAAE